MQPFAVIALLLILGRAFAELWLSRLNRSHVCAHANEVPTVFHGMIDEPKYRRSIDYTLAKSRFGDIVNVFDAAILMAVLFSGVLPCALQKFSANFGSSVWTIAVFVFLLEGILRFAPS